ncbi:MAG TPA: hypothetical protein ENN27_00555 [Candidatus Atribacteria bacterium]|nr:hypothetical protein [Candidatus Atribacteria bacterium]
MVKKKKEEVKTKGESLVEFVLNRFNYSKNNLADRHAQWKEYYDDYRGTRSTLKEDWQSNYVITSLKEAIRTKIPIYMDILFPADPSKSFDIKPGEESDENAIPALKKIITYQLGNVGRDVGGLFNVVEEHIKQFEIYGYSLTKVPWIEKKENGKTIFEGPDIEICDIFNVFPDPATKDINSSWIVIRKPDVFVSHLRQLEKQGIYHSIIDLKDTSQPGGGGGLTGENKINTDRVELLEYHGDIPKSLLEGKISDETQVNPYEDDYIRAIVTIANRKVCIRNVKYPYDCGNIFVYASKDKMPNEQFGVGTGEDIQSYAEELTNAHNKLSDCVNIIANPMAIINQQKMAGISGGIVISHPGKLFFTNPNVDDVNRAMAFVNTTAQAASLSPLITFIRVLEEKIQKTTQAVPVISAMPTSKELPETLGATRIMQGNAAEPIKHIVKHCLEPWYQRVLEIIYKHNIQFFSKEMAYRVLGKEKGAIWEAEKKRKEIKKEDIKLAGNPDFIPRGVSIFEEKQVELWNLLQLIKMVPRFLKPVTDPMGNVQVDAEGKPAMEPVFNLEEIAKRVGESMNFSDLEKLIPGLKEERERKEAKMITTKAGISTPATPQQGAGRMVPPQTPVPVGVSPTILAGGRRPIIQGGKI